MLKLALIGCGKMGSALATGILSQQAESQVFGFDALPQACQALARSLPEHLQARFVPCDDAIHAVEQSQACLLAVKPRQLHDAIPQDPRAQARLFISIAAGIPLHRLREMAPNARWLRAMPNTPALLGEGISVLHVPKEHCPEDLAMARLILGPVGELIEIEDESLMHVVTALSGSGPAFAAVVVEALADGAVNEGLPRQLAYHLARATLRGSMALLEDQHPAQLKDAVASPGGTTMAGLCAAEAAGLRFALIDAIRQATARSRELAKEGGGTGQAPNRQEVGGTGQAPNRQEVGELAERPIDKKSQPGGGDSLRSKPEGCVPGMARNK
ncbi:MAG: pyrroline-5-carboxylate reductase [Myxococcota bacterium]|nr:pyrroline-5-carboxylate reductase [Myxococcota bacterium]